MTSTQTARAPQGFGFRLKVFGIPVTVEITFVLIALLLGSNRRSDAAALIEWVAVVFFSVLFHELGHALVGRAYGLEPQIRLYAFGGLTSWARGRDITPGRSILLSAAGPGAGFLLGGLVFFIAVTLGSRGSLLAKTAVGDLLRVNIGWGLLNLLPSRPLDGGNIAFSLEQLITGNKNGRITQIGSLMLASAAALWAFSAGQYWILMLTGLMAFSNGQGLFLALKTRLDKALRIELDEAWRCAATGDPSAAVSRAEHALRRARSDEIRRESRWILITGLYQMGGIEQAAEEFKRLQALSGADSFRAFGDELDGVRALLFFQAAFNVSGIPAIGYWYGELLIREKRYEEVFELCARPELQDLSGRLYLLLESAAFQDGQYAVSARAGTLAFAREPLPEVAYNLACAFARQSEIDEAIKWVKVALDAGFKDLELLKTDPDLDSLRGHADFQQVIT